MGRIYLLGQKPHHRADTTTMPSTDVVSSFPQTEAASAVSEIGQDSEQPQPSPGLWTRMVRAMRAWWIR
jgi:hypothetical protein